MLAEPEMDCLTSAHGNGAEQYRELQTDKRVLCWHACTSILLEHSNTLNMPPCYQDQEQKGRGPGVRGGAHISAALLGSSSRVTDGGCLIQAGGG